MKAKSQIGFVFFIRESTDVFILFEDLLHPLKMTSVSVKGCAVCCKEMG